MKKQYMSAYSDEDYITTDSGMQFLDQKYAGDLATIWRRGTGLRKIFDPPYTD